MADITLNVPDISCSHCERTILNALQGREGVQSVRVNVPAKAVYLTYDEGALSLDHVKDILDEEGYTVASIQEGVDPNEGKRKFIPLLSK